jgi:hypothetical protein
MRYLLMILPMVLVGMAVACGEGGVEEPASTPTSEAGVSLTFRQASYSPVDTLPLDDLEPDDVEEIGRAGDGSQGSDVVYQRKSGGAEWELVTSSEDGWTVWQPGAVTLAIADLAQHLDIPEEEIEVRQVDRVQWPDSCLGAAQAGEVCAEVITDGFKIILSVEGRGYEYHSNLGDIVRTVF